LSLTNLGFGSAGNGGTKTISTTATITGTVTQSGTATLTANSIILKSTASSTARIAALTSGSVINSTVTAERYYSCKWTQMEISFISSCRWNITTMER
jgi:hypothetical protein